MEQHLLRARKYKTKRKNIIGTAFTKGGKSEGSVQGNSHNVAVVKIGNSNRSELHESLFRALKVF